MSISGTGQPSAKMMTDRNMTGRLRQWLGGMGIPHYAIFIHKMDPIKRILVNSSLFESYVILEPPLPVPDRSCP